MKTNKRPELVLSLIGIAALARETLAASVQKRLFGLGFQWKPSTNSDTGKKPAHLDADWLRVNTISWNRRRITHGKGPIPSPKNDESLVFDAATQLDAFFDAARSSLVESCVPFEGVKVTVCPSGVDVDATEFLANIKAEAEKVREAFYGNIPSVEAEAEAHISRLMSALISAFGRP